jgi:hypothetical protein
MITFREYIALQNLDEKEIKYDIKQNEKIVGYYKLDIDDKSIRIADIQMNISGTGLGTQTIINIMKRATKDGKITTLTSDAMRGKENQKKNRELYKKLGFVKNTGKNKLKEAGYEEFYSKGVDI